uniref:MYND-type domain-containing protein n=1 Tax=Kalanchoe fedtschenkoi TaxID=63787 RepID=A0A7N0U1K4_KALFE
MECAAKGGRTRCLGPPKRLCSRCGAVAYCSVSHQLAHARAHREECGRLEQHMRRVHETNDFPFEFAPLATTLVVEKTETRCSVLSKLGVHRLGMWLWECSCGKWINSLYSSRVDDSWNLPCKLSPCRAPESPMTKILSGWKDYYEWRCIPLASPVSLLLHWPLTIYHATQITKARNLLPDIRDTLHIHYLGPERELSQLAVFGELCTLFPGVQVKIELFGPAISSHRDGAVINLYASPICTDRDSSHTSLINCPVGGAGKAGSSCVSLHLHRGLYHERFGDKNFVPDIIVAPNAGVAAYSSWLATIELIKEQNIFAIFSDYCEEACHLAVSCMSRAAGISLTVPIQLNPFRQPMAVEDSAFPLPCYSNCFLFGI